MNNFIWNPYDFLGALKHSYNGLTGDFDLVLKVKFDYKHDPTKRL